MLDILIKNGTVIDGSGKAARPMDVGIENGKIVELGLGITAKANKVIDAKGHFVTPGFIDIQNHSDSYWTIFDEPGQGSLLSQGITTIIMGNCGASLAPLVSQESIKAMQKWHDLSGININWASFAELMKVLSSKPLGVNVGSLVGHATIRRGILGDSVRAIDKEETMALENLTKQALDEGALGISFGLVYSHEMNSSRDELVRLGKLLKPSNKFLSVHLRSEGSGILDSIDEILDLAGATEVPIKISHLKIRGTPNWHLFDRMIAKLELAYHRGLPVSFDVYPYDTSWSVLYTYLPKWSYEGGREAIVKNLTDENQRRKILDYVRGREYEYDKIVIASSVSDSLVGKNLMEIAKNQNTSPAEALLNVLAVSTQAVVFDQNLSAEHVELLCASPLSMIATDGAGFDSKQKGLIHPRCFGTMPKFLSMVREKKIDQWEYAIKKITSEPAKLLGLTDRGLIATGMAADVVVFDPQTIAERSDYLNPDVLSTGIETVIINGQVSLQGKLAGSLNGTVLKR